MKLVYRRDLNSGQHNGDFIIAFITSNENKFKEAKEILKNSGIRIRHIKKTYSEIRADDVKQVALESAKSLFLKFKKPLIVEDSGLFIPSLNGFPGAYSAWVYKKIGNQGIINLLKGKPRRAYFKSCVAYADSKIIKTFCGKVLGKISKRERGTGGFGYDPIFVPNGKRQTFGENEMLKNSSSHRCNAFILFIQWYKKYFKQYKQYGEF